jgi:hypothetical protein
MQYTLTRYEKIRDHDGNITEIFISIAIDNGSEIYNHGHWLLPEEVSAVTADPSAISDIVVQASAAGKLAQENLIATRPLEPIIEEVENIVIDPSDVSEYLN